MKYFGFLSLMGILVLMGAGCNFDMEEYIEQSNSMVMDSMTIDEEMEIEPLITYDLGEVPASLRLDTEPVDALFSADQLVAYSQECGTNKTEEHFSTVLELFNDEYATTHAFMYEGEYQGDGEFVYTVVPNAPGYADLEAFKSDFGICAAGGDLYPRALNEAYLLFASSCGSGLDDGSGLPIGCNEISAQLAPNAALVE